MSDEGSLNPCLVNWLEESDYIPIIQNMYQHKEFARATMILLDGTHSPLDYQAANFCVALETICTKIKKLESLEFGGKLEKGIWTRIRKKTLKSMKEAFELYKIDKAMCAKFEQSLAKLNDISNADKFWLTIDRAGIQRTDSDNDAIAQHNYLLHGDTDN